MNIKKILITASILLVILIGVVIIIWLEMTVFTSKRVLTLGEILPDYSGTTNTGSVQSLSQFQGKYILLNFWAVWCEPCKSEMPVLQDIYLKNRDQIVIIGVDQGDPPEVLEQFLFDNKITFPIWLDKKSSIADNYLIKAFPTTLIISPSRELLAIHIGELNSSVLRKYIGDIK